eukprot:TRINITY_DN27772_c0_g7_i1.p1 TRINITY_DN27772_c0_g7~~TRINITY_DN27772_c0_g7_i1.p1  ORF type:complete len:319 (-),score=54.85 TRINITY_DN27772_c0_g7_i1:99-1055(-)
MPEVGATPAVGGRGINPGAWVKRSSAVEDDEDDIPEEYGWPPKAYTLDELQVFVKEKLESMSLSAIEENGVVDAHAYEKGRWYRLAFGASGSEHVYVHNYTRELTRTRPQNCTELTEKERRLLGTSIVELPSVLQSIYTQKKKIPIVYGTEAACHAFKNYATYGSDAHLLDTSVLRRVNEKSLEECRRAIVCAMKNGLKLCVYVGDHVCDFSEKVCVAKNKSKFPIGLFTYKGLEGDTVKDNIFSSDDREGGQCVVREGFMVFLLVPYGDGGGAMEISSCRKNELRMIPNIDFMEELRCHCEEDRVQLLQELSRKSTT